MDRNTTRSGATRWLVIGVVVVLVLLALYVGAGLI